MRSMSAIWRASRSAARRCGARPRSAAIACPDLKTDVPALRSSPPFHRPSALPTDPGHRSARRFPPAAAGFHGSARQGSRRAIHLLPSIAEADSPASTPARPDHNHAAPPRWTAVSSTPRGAQTPGYMPTWSRRSSRNVRLPEFTASAPRKGHSMVRMAAPSQPAPTNPQAADPLIHMSSVSTGGPCRASSVRLDTPNRRVAYETAQSARRTTKRPGSQASRASS